jgi:hypothetical protein
MTQTNAKIRDALKTEYADFVDFCLSLDKQFISELVTSDFIAFRVQWNVTRDYVAKIRKVLDNYNPDAEIPSEDAQENLRIEEPAAIDAIGNGGIVSEKPEPEIPEIATEEVRSKESGVADLTVGNRPTTNITPIRLPAFRRDRQHNAPKKLLSMDEEIPLYDLLGIPRNPMFAYKDVTQLRLSTRSYNCLLRNRCNTFDALLSKTQRELSDFSNLGKQSLAEIVEKCRELATTPQTKHGGEVTLPEVKTNLTVENGGKLLTIAVSIALGIEYDVSGLSEGDKRLVHSAEEAYRVLGEDLCLIALEDPDKAQALYLMLDDYVEQHGAYMQGRRIVDRLSRQGICMDLHVLPFVEAMKNKMWIDLRTVFTDDDRFSDMPMTIERYLGREPQNQAALMNSLQMFADAVGAGIIAHLERAYKSAVTSERISIVVEFEQEGYTLREIGELLDLTRERVRQVKNKAIHAFCSNLNCADVDIIAYLYALLGGEMMIHKDQIAAFVPDSEHLNLLWACVKNGNFDCKTYSYQNQYRAIVFNHESIDLAEKIVGALPEYIFKEELEEIVRHAVAEKGALEKMIRAKIKQRYKLFGTLYGIRRPTLSFICDWVLKNRFAHGFKVNDETDTKRFLGYIRDIFGEEYSHMTPRALDAKVSIQGILCDRGKYIHPSAVHIDQGIFDEIDRYIMNSPKNAISFMELFDAFKDRFAGTQITNHWFLQGVIKQYRGMDDTRKDYHYYRGYVTKDEEISPTDEFDAFVRERGIVHKDEIYAEFPALDDISILRVISRCPSVLKIYDGNYMHTSHLHIHEDDYTPLRTYLAEATRELPANIRKVFDDCSVQFPVFMDRNALYNRDMLFAVLNYMFGNEFRFNKPYIASSDDADTTNRGVILGLLEPYDEIEIDELMEMLDERGINYASLSVLLQLVAPEYMRSDANMLMKRELTGIDDDIEKEALNVLSEMIKARGYLPSGKVRDFIWFPSIDVVWTPYLLESVVLSSNKIDYVPYISSRSKRTLVVYVDKKYAQCDSQSLILRVLAEEYNKGMFTNKTDMREWLLDAGLIEAKLPNFLESAQYYYMDENGRLTKREEPEQ